jgi:hypothetical protein
MSEENIQPRGEISFFFTKTKNNHSQHNKTTYAHLAYYYYYSYDGQCFTTIDTIIRDTTSVTNAAAVVHQLPITLRSPPAIAIKNRWVSVT